MRVRLAERLLMAVAVIALSVLSMSRLLGPTGADLLLHSLMSTQRLTFYYWGQDRLANVLALAGWPVQNVRWNFYVLMLLQGVMFYGFVALIVVFVSRTINPRRSLRSEVFILVAVVAVVVAVLTPPTLHIFVFEQQYVLSLVLFFVGLALLLRCSRRWILVGVALLTAALVVVPASVLFLPFAAVFLDSWDRRRLAIALGATAVAFAIAALGPSVFYDGTAESGYREFSLSLLSSGWRDAGSGVVKGVRLRSAIGCLVLCVVILVTRWQQLPVRLRLLLLGAPPFALSWFGAFTANAWVTQNLHYRRYYFAVYFALIVIIAVTVVVAVDWARGVLVERGASIAVRPLRVVAAGLTVSLLILAVGVFRLATDDGIPVVAQAIPGADVARDMDVEVVVGDYWQVWPIVYASLSRGDELFGITFRAEALKDEVVDEVEAALADPGDELALMCIDLDPSTCVATFAAFVGGDWEAVSIELADPLVVTVRPADR